MIKQIEKRDIPGRRSKFNNQVERDIIEFFDSGWEACEVATDKYKSLLSAYNSYRVTAKRLNIGVGVFSREGRLFLAKEK